MVESKNFSLNEQGNEIMSQKYNEVNVEETVDEYLDKLDWRVNANANQGYSLGGLMLNAAGKLSANYWLNKVYNKKVGKAHRNGDLHIHDLDLLSPYCFSGDTKIRTKEYGLISLRELSEKYGDKEFTVYSKDKDMSDVEGIAFNASKTREDAELLELEFEDGHKVKCTPDHKFLLKSGEWRMAKDLNTEDDIAVYNK